MLVTKYFDNKVLNHIDTWSEPLSYISWTIRDSYHRTIMATPYQAVFGREMLVILAPVVDWQIVTATNQRQVEIGNVR